MNDTSLFQTLRQKKKILYKQTVVPEVFFQLNFDDTGAYLEVVDKDQNPVNPDYEYYSGSDRDLLKSIRHIRERAQFQVAWFSSERAIYLHDHEYLLWQLRGNSKFVNTEMTPLRFAGQTARVMIEISSKDSQLISRIYLICEGEKVSGIRFLTESHALANDTIFHIEPLGNNFQNLSIFETSMAESLFENYLSLLYSHADNIQLNYENYKVVPGPDKQTQPALIIEQIDEDNSLYLRISSTLPGFDSDFLDNYEITKTASLHELEQKIYISSVIHENIYNCFQKIEKRLKQVKRKIPEKADYHIEDNLFIIEEALARAFIYQDLTHLLSEFEVFGADILKNYKVRPVTPSLNIRLDHGIDFLEGDVSLQIDDQAISLFDVLTQLKTSGYIRLSDGSHAIINKEYIARLRRLFRKKEKKVRVSFFDLPLVEELIDEKIARESFQKSREIFLGFNKLKQMKTTFPKLTSDLRTYQKQGYKWLYYLHKHNLGGCLADDMGLGKTIQAIAVLSHIYPKTKKPSLIIMPRTLLYNWSSEIEKFNPKISSCIYHGPNRDIKAVLKCNCILTTYATVRNDIEKFKEKSFYYIILDESQCIKNLSSQNSKAVMLLQSKHRLALSGTPVENNLSELYALFRFLNPAMFGSMEDFNRSYLYPIQREDNKQALHELRKKIYPFILRRLKKEVLKDLPEKIEQVLYMDMSPKQTALYEERRNYYYETVRMQIARNGIKKSQFAILQALSELRQIASVPESKSKGKIISPKREMLLENILDVIANDHKVLVFANFLHALETIGEDLQKEQIDYLVMTGATRDRQTLVDQFQNEDQIKVFLMTLKTGGLGLNLTAADHIFIYDPWWNISAENQAVDRTHRIGQDKTVFSYKLIARKSIEEKILELQRIKKELFEELISSDGASIKSLDEKDVDFVLGVNNGP